MVKCQATHFHHLFFVVGFGQFIIIIKYRIKTTFTKFHNF